MILKIINILTLSIPYIAIIFAINMLAGNISSNKQPSSEHYRTYYLNKRYRNISDDSIFLN